jgi:RNA polymerase sigma-70 factor
MPDLPMPSMPSETPLTAAAEGRKLESLLSSHRPLIDRLYVRAGAARWGLAHERFADSLRRSAASRFRDAHPAQAELARYLESLHVEDLALACACTSGCEAAWEFFVTNYRQELYRAARAIAGSGAGEAQARELADSLYGDLYGLGDVPGTRRPLFDYFHGRSKLSTWLRAVLAQRRVDALRAARRTESLDDRSGGEEQGEVPAERGPDTPPPDPRRARYLALFEAALGEALAALAPRERLRLAYYYLHERTLAEIGRILGEHEASVSRHLERARRALRQSTLERLRAGRPTGDGPAPRGLSEPEIELCIEYAAGDWPFDLARALESADGAPKTPSHRTAKPPLKE